MSYQVIARKWRPQSFDEVTGQEAITRTLSNAIEHHRLHHAYLFSGARGVGKTTTARLLAKALNCHKSDEPTVTPCRMDDPSACPSCREVAEGRSIDVLEIDAASNTGVDSVRESIINTVGIRPSRDRYRIFIIDEVHMLSGAAFNALLKTLEEPPPRVMFIMATTEAHKLPDTILSRCQQFQFRTIPTKKIFERLRLIADAEKIDAADDALREIARAGAGSMRDAQSAFDQTISFSTERITTDVVETALGIAGSELLTRTARAIAEERPGDALRVVDDLAMRGHDLRNFNRDLMSYLRDLLVIKIGASEDEEDAEQRAVKKRLADAFSESDLVRFFHSLTETERNLRESAHPRYQLEIGLVKLIEMRRLAPLTQIIERLTTLEQAMIRGSTPAHGTSGNTASPVAVTPKRTGAREPFETQRSQADAVSQTQNAEPVGVASLDAKSSSLESFPTSNSGGTSSAVAAARPLVSSSPPPSLKLVTPVAGSQTSISSLKEDQSATEPSAETTSSEPKALAERIKSGLEERRRPFLAIALDGAGKVILEGTEVRIDFPPEAKHLRENLARAENLKILREVCNAIAGREMKVTLTIGEANKKTAALSVEQQNASDEKTRLREIAEKNPVVQQILKTFRGEIIDVRRVEE